jgi:tetratricopeptide (TPR) repeat protein/nucleoside phosphorylase
MRQRTKTSKTPVAPVDFLLITALEEERDAVLSTLRGARKLDKEASDVTTCYAARVRSKRRDRSQYDVIVTSLLHMGPINASAQAVALVHRWKPRHVLLVGIACGVRGEVAHGDVLIASQVADYTLGKQLNGRRQVRWEVFPCGASLLDSANNIPPTWLKAIGVSRPGAGTPQRRTGVVASGGDVIADDQVIATYSESWPKLVGIEMEAGGVAAGVHQTPDRPEFLMIKGVSDFGSDKHDPEVVPWRAYANHAAAALALSLIKSGPARSLSEITEREQALSEEEEKTRAAERRWEYIQNHPLRGIELLFLLKGLVGFGWFCELLAETRLTFSHETSFKLGQLLPAAPPPNTKEHSRAMDEPLCSFWEFYESEPGFWVRTIAPEPRTFSVVAGFDAVVPWSMLGIDHIKNLEDLARLTELSVSIPARAYQVGVEEFALRFVGETYSFSAKLSDSGTLGALHEFARMQHTVNRDDDPMPVGTGFNGVQLLDMFRDQLLPHPKRERSKGGIGMSGLAGPDGRAISFYPAMPLGFNKTAAADNYVFKVTMPPKVDSKTRIAELKQRLRTEPLEAETYVELATYYLYEGRMLDVVQCLETAIREAPPNARVHGLLGQVLRKMGRISEALVHARTAIALAPDDPVLQTEVGICTAEVESEEAALPFFEAAVRIRPDDYGFQSNLCMALVRLQRLADAIEPAQRAVDLKPDDSKEAMRLGILLESQGSEERARHYLEKSVDLDPESAEAHEHLGSHLAKHDLHAEALPHLQRAADIAASARRLELVGGSHADLSQWSEAEDAFRQAVALKPNDSGLRTNLAFCVANLGRAPEAVTLLEQALQDDPTNARAERALAELRESL